MIPKTFTAEITVDMNDVDFTATPYHPAILTADPYNSSPAEGGLESIDAVWISLPDTNGLKVKVNILSLLDEKEVEEAVEEFTKDGDGD